jgi:hypothetical protein
MPDFRHPFNRYLAGEFDETEAQALMPAYIELLKKEHAEK